MKFEIGDFVEAKPEYYSKYGHTTKHWIGKIIRLSRDGTEFDAKSFRGSSTNSYSFKEGVIWVWLNISHFRKVSDFKLAIIKNMESNTH